MSNGHISNMNMLVQYDLVRYVLPRVVDHYIGVRTALTPVLVGYVVVSLGLFAVREAFQ